MKRVKSMSLSGQVPKIVFALLMLLSIISCATLTRRDQHIFELAQNGNNRQTSASTSNPSIQLLGALLENDPISEESWRSTDLVETSSDDPVIVYATNHDISELGTPKVTKIISIEEQEDDADLGHVQRSWLDRNPKSRNLIATGIMGSAIAYALTSVRKASHMDPVPDSVQHALAIVNPVAKPVHKENIKRDEELDSPSFVKRAHGRWRAGALGAALGGFAMYIHSNKLVPDIKESLWPSRNSNGNGKRGTTEIIFVRDDEVEDDFPQKRADGKNLAYPLYATAAAVGLYGLHKYNNGGFQTQAQTTLQKRSVIPEEPEKEEIQLERRGRGWRDTGSLNARIMVSPSHKQVKVYWQSGGVARFDRQVNNPNGGSSGDEQGNWRTVQSFGARAFLPRDRGQLKIIWRSGNITMYDRNGGGQGNSPPPNSSNNNNNSNNNGPNNNFGDFSQPNSAFSSLHIRGHRGCTSLIWLVIFALTAFLTLGSVSAEDGEAIDGFVRSHGLEKRQFIFRRSNITESWTGVHDLNAESKISPSHNLVKVIWHSGNVTTYNRTEGQSPPVLQTFLLPDDEPVMWRTVKSYHAKTQLSIDHEKLRVLWNSGNITNFAKLPPNPAPATTPGQSNPVQNRSQINNVIPLPGPKSTDNDSNDSQANNATTNAAIRSKTVGSVGITGLLLFWCVFLLFSGEALAEESTNDRINSADLVKRSNVLAAQTQLDSTPVTKRSRLQAGEEGEKISLVRRGPYNGWTPLSAMPARSFISPSHDQLKMERQGGNGPEIFIRDKDTNGPPLPPNHQWQRLRDINAKARLSQDETRIAVRWNSGSITEYIRRSTLQKRSLPDEDSAPSHAHRFHRRHVSTTAHDTHEHTAKDFQLGRVSPQSHHKSYYQRKAQAQAQAKHHKNSGHGSLRRGSFGFNDNIPWLIVSFAFSVLFFASASMGSELETIEDGLAPDLFAKRSLVQLTGASSASSPSLAANVPLHFNSVRVSSIPHSTLGSIQGYKSNTARKALRESPPPEPAQVQASSRKSRLRQKRGPGKSATVKREVGSNDEMNQTQLLKRSIATVSSLAPSSAPMSSHAFAPSQSSTAFTQDNWHDGNPGKPSRPRNSVAIHEEFARQYGRKDGIEDSRRDLKGGGVGGRGGVRGGTGGYRRPVGGGGGKGKKSAASGNSSKNAALLAGGAAVGTAMALNQAGGGRDKTPSSKKTVGSIDSRSKKSRLRNNTMSVRALQNEEHPHLKRSMTSYSGQAAPMSQSSVPSMASSSTSSGLPRSLAGHHAEQVRHYQSIAKEYPVTRQMFDEKKASVRDSQLPKHSKNEKAGVSESRPRQSIKDKKSHAVTTGLVATGAAGIAGAEAHRRMRKAAEKKGGVRFAGIDKRSVLTDAGGLDLAAYSKRSIVPYTGQAVASSEPPLPSVTEKPTSSTSSASGLYDVWPNGQPGAPKNLAAHQARQRNQYEKLIRLPSSARPSSAQSPSQGNSVSNVGTVFSTGVAAAGIAVAGYPIAYQYIDRNRRRRARHQQGMKKRSMELEEPFQAEAIQLLPRINPPSGKMEKALLIGSSALLAAGGLVATKAVLTPPKPIGEKRDIGSMDESARDMLVERSPISAGAKNLMIGLGSVAGVGGLTLHALNRDAVHKDKGYGVGKVADQVW